MRQTAIAALASVTLSVGVVSIASAADMPVKAPIMKAPVVAAFNWTGLTRVGQLARGRSPGSHSVPVPKLQERAARLKLPSFAETSVRR